MTERYCKDCNAKLIVGENWYPSQEINHKYRCIACQRKADRERHRPVDALSKRSKSAMAREECIRLLGNRCERCSFSDIRALLIDHVNGGGAAERRNIGNSRYFQTILARIKAGSSDYQCLCANCNTIKARERKEYGQRKWERKDTATEQGINIEARNRKPEPISHGTHSGYSHKGCRCDACRKAHNLYQAQYRKGKNELVRGVAG